MNEKLRENEILKGASVEKQQLTDEALALINKQSLKVLTAEDVFVFKISACNNLIDRDNECFADSALEQMAKLYVGKTVIMDHHWRASGQTARIYAGAVELIGNDEKHLILSAYMLKNNSTEATIAAIEGGILREVSVGVRAESAVCNICGKDKRKTFCEHYPGAIYNGTKCHIILSKVTDAYEVSFVAVPAQPAAGVRKSYGGEDTKPEPEGNPESFALKNRIRLAEAQVSMKNMEDDTDE